MLVVQPSGSAQWVFRFQMDGRRRDMGLGPAPTKATEAKRARVAVSLAEAREKATEARKQIAAGIDPLEARAVARDAQEAAVAAQAEVAQAVARTFAVVADEYLAAHEAGWRNAKHRAQWKMTLTNYAGPHFGNLPVADVKTEQVLSALKPIWTTKPETGSRLRGRVEAVLDFARVQGWREGENPARWRGHLDHLLPRRSKLAAVEHHPALPWKDAPRFWQALRRKAGTGAAALRFAILCAARSGEVRRATWGEIDLAAKTWTVPAARMKAGRAHRIPLQGAALAILLDQLPDEGEPDPNDLVFPGQRKGSPLSDMTLTAMARGMACDGLKAGEAPRWRDAAGAIPTVHGFRSTFRDWAGETTNHAREVVEAALAHSIKDKAEAAYARGDLFAKRRQLMVDWSAYLAGEVTQ